MDNPKAITAVEWCFGYGGNHLGLRRVLPGLRVIAACEIEGYAVANLVSKIEGGRLCEFPVWSDVKTFPCELFRDLVDIFIASYPCQPFSSAGRRGGADDPRHLWPFVRRAIEIIRPRYVFLENVEGHVSLGLREVLTELALLGYRVENSRGEPTWGIFSAAEVGAPQNRKRVFIVAKRQDAEGCLDDALRELAERFNSGRFLAVAGGAGELADSGPGADGTEHRQQQGQHPEELQGCTGLENAGSDERESGPRARLSSRQTEGAGSTDQPHRSDGAVRELEDPESRRAGAVSTRPRHEGSGTSEPDGSGEGVGQANSSIERLRESHNKEHTFSREDPREDIGGRSGVGQADASEPGLEGRRSPQLPAERRPWFWPDFVARPGEQQHEWEPPRVIKTERGLGGGVNGRASNVDRLRLLGNGVYPATAALAFVTLFERLHK